MFRIASMGTARIAPSTPHIQNQNTSGKIVNTGQSFAFNEMNAKVEDRQQLAHHKVSKLSIVTSMKMQTRKVAPKLECS
jgi:hypothetical protein